MATSSILGADHAPTQPRGRDADLLGPSDLSDSGSDTVGASDAYADSDSGGTGERGAGAGPDAVEGADIMPDRIVNAAGQEVDDDSGDGVLEAGLVRAEMSDLEAGDAEDGEAPDKDR